MSYNPVPLTALAEVLEKAGFTRTVTAAPTREVVYELAHKKDSRLLILVYTSVVDGEQLARQRGKDAIRTCLVAERPSDKRRFGICKAKRVNRTGETLAILDRVLARAREMYQAANAHQSTGASHCDGCSGPVYQDSGRCILRCYYGKPLSVAS